MTTDMPTPIARLAAYVHCLMAGRVHCVGTLLNQFRGIFRRGPCACLPTLWGWKNL